MLVITIFCLSTYIALPNVMTSEFLPSTKLNLGLDIRGGISILLEADFSAYKQEQLLIIKNSISKELKGVKAHIYHDDIIFNCDIASLEKASSTILEKQYFSIKELNDEAILTIKKSFFHIKEINIIDRIIDVIRYRIDATGTQEITIQKQSNDCVLVQIPGTNDRAAIKNILSQTGSLKLHLVDVNITNEQIANHEIPLGIKLLPMTQDDNKIIEFAEVIQTQNTILNTLLYEPIYRSFKDNCVNISTAVKAKLDATNWLRIFEHICHKNYGISKPSINSVRDFCRRLYRPWRPNKEPLKVVMSKKMTVSIIMDIKYDMEFIVKHFMTIIIV